MEKTLYFLLSELTTVCTLVDKEFIMYAVNRVDGKLMSIFIFTSTSARAMITSIHT